MPEPLKYYLGLVFIVILLFVNSLQTLAQKEFLVTVDPSNGSFSKVDSIHGVMWIELFNLTSINENNSHFTFVGSPDQADWKLITLDEQNGNILSGPSLANNTNLISLDYTKTNNFLYGVVVNSGAYSFVTFNIQSGIYSPITNIPLETISEFVLDDANHRIIINGTYNGNLVLMTMDILTGNIISRVPFTNIQSMVYNNLTNKLYGLSSRITSANTNIITVGIIDPNTGIFSQMADLPPEVQGIVQGNETFNENNNTYIFAASDNSGNTSLYSIDGVTGSVIYKAPVSITNKIDADNLIQFRFDNTSGKLYALHWEAKSVKPSFDSSCKLDIQTKLYPNPFSDFLIVEKNPTICKVRMNLYNTLGQILIQSQINDGKNEIHLQRLPKGVYFYKFISDANTTLTGKIIKQ